MRQAVIQFLAIAVFGASTQAWAAGGTTTADAWPPSPTASSTENALVAEKALVVGKAVMADQDHRLAGIRAHEEVLLLNADAAVGARLWLNPGSAAPAFVYADVGATNSALRWQGFAGVHGSHGVDLVGGWRRVTYHYSPGEGLDSLDFDGPFLGAILSL